MSSEPTYQSLGWVAARLARHIELALSAVDLSTAQYRMLVQLAQGSEASTELARKLAVSAPSVTAVVDGLAQRGAVERSQSAEDRRRVSLTLTPQGHVLLDAAEDAVRGRLEGIADELGDEALTKQALASLDLWAAALDAHRARRLAKAEPQSAAARA